MANSLPKPGQSAAAWNPTGAPEGDATAKLMTPNAKDHPDSATPTNDKTQWMGGKSAGKMGTLGKQGHGF